MLTKEDMASKNKIASALYISMIIAMAFYSYLVPPLVRSISYYFTSSLVSLGIFVIFVEIISALLSPPDVYTPYPKSPKAYAVVAALLPNEQEIVFDILDHYAKLVYPDLTVILVYNSPYDMELMKRLDEYAEKNSRFIVRRIVGSSSKAENVNYAIDHLIPEDDAIVGFFDCDHRPCINTFEKVAKHIDGDGKAFVQGKCRVRNNKENLLTKFLMFDFEIMYSIFHTSRFALWRYAIFGGSNGYWNSGVVKKLRFDGSMLTEDIDLTMRALLEGHKGSYDNTIISTELAPLNMRSLINQRLRWAQGWFQVSVKYFFPALFCKHLTFRNKIGMFFMLGIREIIPYCCILINPLVLVYYINGGTVSILGTIATVITLVAYPIAFVALRKISRSALIDNHKTACKMLGMGLFYSFFNVTLSIISHFRNLVAFDSWQTTSRK